MSNTAGQGIDFQEGGHNMADSNNVELNDGAMADATGGNNSFPGPKYEVGTRIKLKISGDDGTAATIVGVIEDRRADENGWEYLVMYQVNGAPYQHWYPECDI